MTDPTTTQDPPTAKGRKVVALGLGVSGLAILLYDSFRPKPFPEDPSPTWGVGLALMLVGLVVFGFARSGKTKSMQSLRSVVVLALIMGAIWYAIIAPNFQRMPKQALQGEAKATLVGIRAAEMEFYEEHKRFGNFEEISFALTGTRNRYTYRIDHSGAPGTMIPSGVGKVTPDDMIVPAGISADGQGFTATATGHLDNDDTIDQWHINDIMQGLPTADVNDVWQ